MASLPVRRRRSSAVHRDLRWKLQGKLEMGAMGEAIVALDDLCPDAGLT